jgi:hypothetical protein
MLEKIKINLDTNQNLSDEMRDMLYGLTVVFNKHFPEVRLKNLSEKFKSLNIEKISKYVQGDVVDYSVRNNSITFNMGLLKDDQDIKHLLMFNLLRVITSDGSNTGFDIHGELEALNLGYTEILANNLVGNESNNFYYGPQATYANIIGTIVGYDKMKDAYFYNKPKLIFNALEEAGVQV